MRDTGHANLTGILSSGGGSPTAALFLIATGFRYDPADRLDNHVARESLSGGIGGTGMRMSRPEIHP